MVAAREQLDEYSPDSACKEMPNLLPLVEEAATSNTELWLVQLPVKDLGPNDLTDTQWSMQESDSGGKMGHFYSSRGEKFDVVREKINKRKLYAMMPGSSQHSVRRITSKVCFVRHFDVPQDTPVSGRTKSGVTTSEAKSRDDSTKSVRRRASLDERQTSTVTQGSIGNAEVERENKKEKRKKEKKSKLEASK